MKRCHSLVAAAAFLAAAAAPAAAQIGEALQLGLKGGVTFSTASVEDDAGVDIGYLTAFGGGAFLSIPLGGLALQPEVLWVRKGASVTGEDFDEGTVDLKLDYLEVPVLLVLPLGGDEGMVPYLFGGGAVAFETGCKFAVEAPGVSVEFDCDDTDPAVDLELERKDVDYGAVFGLGVRLPAGGGAFLLEGRYTLGLADLDDSGAPDGGFKNRSIAAYVGFSFSPGG